MPSPLDSALARLTEIQRRAVSWSGTPLLVLAGPGSGKTQVITCRIAQLLAGSIGEQFRVLALTFTNKAAAEMKDRVAALAPGLDERATIGTFHWFCSQVLRQHGIHLGIRPDFTIYSADADRRAVLAEALQGVGELTATGRPRANVNYLPVIDRLKSLLIEPAKAAAALPRAEDPESIALAYRLYEAALKRLNALDFNSLILEAYRLLTSFPLFAARYRRTYPQVLIDEFQDTNTAQYQLVRAIAGEAPANLIAVADDDQIIYEWNGASFRRLEAFTRDLRAEVLQLPTNYRCPAAVVEAANRLVVYNAHRSALKAPLLPGRPETKFPLEEQIELRVYEDAAAESEGVASAIADRGREAWRQTVVLARTRALLDSIHEGLRGRGVPSFIAQRRDDFLTPEFRWLVAAIRQIARPLDTRNLTVLIESFNRLSRHNTSVEEVTSYAETSGRGYFETWFATVSPLPTDEILPSALTLIQAVARDTARFWAPLDELWGLFERAAQREAGGDLADDVAAWRGLCREIRLHAGATPPLEEFLQELQLRSKEPPTKQDEVTLMTIHAAKGREFDYVYLIGLAEDILPSFQSRQRGSSSPAMEEERRNCFVAITRTREKLMLSRALEYRGWKKEPSRFLVEMGLHTGRVEW